MCHELVCLKTGLVTLTQPWQWFLRTVLGRGSVNFSAFPIPSDEVSDRPVVRLVSGELYLMNNLISLLCQMGSKTYLP